MTDVAVMMLQLSAAELPANWAQWWWWRFNGPARIAASFGGAAIFCIVVLLPKLLVSLNVSWASALILPWWWQTITVMSATTVLWLIVALCTKPDPDELLESFYQRVHPLGFWKRFSKKNAPLPKSSTPPIARGLLIATVGFLAITFLIVGLTHIWFGRYLYSLIEVILSAILWIAFWKISKSFLNYLSLRAGPPKPVLEKVS